MNTHSKTLAYRGWKSWPNSPGDVAAGALYGPHPNPDPRVRAG
jgi:hypothetical protein